MPTEEMPPPAEGAPSEMPDFLMAVVAALLEKKCTALTMAEGDDGVTVKCTVDDVDAEYAVSADALDAFDVATDDTPLAEGDAPAEDA